MKFVVDIASQKNKTVELALNDIYQSFFQDQRSPKNNAAGNSLFFAYQQVPSNSADPRISSNVLVV